MADPTRDQNKFMIRMPDGMRDRIAKAAKANGRSMNSEIIQLLEDHYPPEQEVEDFLTMVEELLDYSWNNSWRDRRKFLFETLSELRDMIRDEVRGEYVNTENFVSGRQKQELELQEIDTWRDTQPDKPTRSEAIRRLAIQALRSERREDPEMAN